MNDNEFIEKAVICLEKEFPNISREEIFKLSLRLLYAATKPIDQLIDELLNDKKHTD